MNSWKEELRKLYFEEKNYPTETKSVDQVFYEKLEAFFVKETKAAYLQGSNDCHKALKKAGRLK